MTLVTRENVLNIVEAINNETDYFYLSNFGLCRGSTLDYYFIVGLLPCFMHNIRKCVLYDVAKIFNGDGILVWFFTPKNHRKTIMFTRLKHRMKRVIAFLKSTWATYQLTGKFFPIRVKVHSRAKFICHRHPTSIIKWGGLLL